MAREESCPMSKFNSWWQKAIENSPLKQKSAVCVSTINSDGFPDGRFVDLKQVDDAGFVFCTYLDSKKGMAISANNKVAITAWWDHVGYQVRVVGHAEEIDAELAKQFWQTRSRSAQITTRCFTQSQPCGGAEEISAQFQSFQKDCPAGPIAKPENWGGYRVIPVSVEFLHFKESRLHLREKYIKVSCNWDKLWLQP